MGKLKLQCNGGVIFETSSVAAYKSELIALALTHQPDDADFSGPINVNMDPHPVRRILQYYSVVMRTDDPVQIEGEPIDKDEELWPKRVKQRKVNGADFFYVDSETKSSVKLETMDGYIFQIDSKIGKTSGVITNIMELCGLSLMQHSVIPLPKITGAELRLVLEWIGHHKTDSVPLSLSGTNQYYVPIWDRDFMFLDDDIIFSLAKAVNFLDVELMDEIVNRTIANMMRGQELDNIRDLFKIRGDATKGDILTELKQIDLTDMEVPVDTKIMASMKRKWEAHEATLYFKRKNKTKNKIKKK